MTPEDRIKKLEAQLAGRRIMDRVRPRQGMKDLALRMADRLERG